MGDEILALSRFWTTAAACSMTKGALSMKRACWGTVVLGRPGLEASGEAKSKVR